MAGDIEAANAMSPNQINSQYERVVRELQRVYPWSRIILVGLTIVGNLQRRQSIQRVNALMQHLALNERMISYLDNNNSKLQDNIHLSYASKMMLGRRIASIVKKPYLDSIQRFR